MYIKAPNPTDQAKYDYLEELRQSGETNMFGAAAYLQAFSLSQSEATGKKAGRFVTSYTEEEKD